uniref:N-alpha-acetyltransferase 60 n=1 Tax=Percolomonas cosmopolitus TaxID=63605 RepID=A0A7S1PGP6_9EUKA
MPAHSMNAHFENCHPSANGSQHSSCTEKTHHSANAFNCGGPICRGDNYSMDTMENGEHQRTRHWDSATISASTTTGTSTSTTATQTHSHNTTHHFQKSSPTSNIVPISTCSPASMSQSCSHQHVSLPLSPLTPLSASSSSGDTSSPSNVTLRTTLTPQDIAPLQDLHSSLFPVPYSSNFFHNLLRHPKIYTCVATVPHESSPNKQRVIGVCSCRIQEERYYDWANMLSDAMCTILSFVCCCFGPLWRVSRVSKKVHKAASEHYESLNSIASRRRFKDDMHTSSRRSGSESQLSPDTSPTISQSSASTAFGATTEYSFSVRTGYIMTLGVTKPYRRRGLASKMLKVIIKKMRDSYHCHQLMLHCKTDNTVALEFYKRAFGFQIEKKISNYYEIDDSLEDAYQLVLKIHDANSLSPKPRTALARWLAKSLSYCSSVGVNLDGWS